MQIPLKVFTYPSPTQDPVIHEVEAFVVGGEEGVWAIYDDPMDNTCFCIAAGDDGHWRHERTFGKPWAKLILEQFSDYVKSLDE